MHESLAIVGMDCRLPGADGLDAFWRLVVGGGIAWGKLPESRLSRELYFDPEKGRVGKSYSELGALVADRPIDRSVCPLRPEMLDRYDVAHHVFLEVASRACRDAGLDPFAMPRQRRTGVYVGHTGGSTRIGDFVYGTGIDGTMAWLEDLDAARVVLGSDAAAVAAEVTAAVRRDHPGRRPGQTLDLVALGAAQIVNEALALEGPYLVVDAACASSLQALAIAARALREGGIDQAIVGGASYCKSDSLVLFSAAQSVSNSGSCPFGRDADGLVTAEGYVALVVKTLSRAIADGDRIRGVIHGIGVASDGKGKSLWAPRQEGQKLAVERAYPDLRDLGRLDYIEAHATSTQVGDATELGALSALLSAQLPPGKQVPIGSVKANVGHTLETAGMASLVKVLLAMEHEVIPPGSTCSDYNEEFDWARGPFTVPREPMAWPRRTGEPRRAAVNAFGIGGLNVHLAIAEHVSEPAAVRPRTAPTAADSDDRAIAIVGMGSVLPGALTTEAFLTLLDSGVSAVGPVPVDRWDVSRALDRTGPRTWHTTADRGGFISGFAYDWRRHKVPPKQIAAANPLQFMLLEAADAAIAAVGGVGALDRIRTAVVVGTMFGGEFAHDLQMGLRLPETVRHLRAALARRGVTGADAERIAEAYRKRLLEKMPALVDETGSFTSSTLASRLTKSFDLMGGALALDSGDCAAASAIAAAVDMLRQRDCDAVVCAAGQRCLDLVAFEGLSLSAGLADGPSPLLAAGGRGRVPGEGAVVLLLKRLADARAAGNRIHGVIRGVAVTAGPSLATTLGRVTEAARTQAGVPAPGIAAVEVVSAGLPDMDAAQCAAIAHAYGPGVIAGTIEGAVGHLGAAAVAAGVVKMTGVLAGGRMPPTVGATGGTAPVQLAATPVQPLPSIGPAGYRAGAITVVQGNQAAHLVIDNGQPMPLAAATLPAPVARPAPIPGTGLVAAIFPGQGSQYADMFRSLAGESAATRACLETLDVEVRAAGFETLADVAWRQPNGLGTVVWDTQWSMFLSDLLAWRVLEGIGFDPHVIASHSFGEFPALVAAGAWTVADGARATRARAEAVDACGPQFGAMLSVIAGREEVAAALATFSGQVWLCAENAPEQSVIGGEARAVDAVEVLLEGRGVRSKRLAVPSPFHTPLLSAAAERLAETIGRLPIEPPRRRIYGSTTAAPLVSAADVRESLVRQMTQTVRWVDLIERLWADGVRTFVEVGPSGVLTGLVRRILEGREGATFIQFDQRGRDAASHLAKVREQLTAAGALRVQTAAAAPRTAATVGSVVHFDATARRRARNRSGAGSRPTQTGGAEKARGAEKTVPSPIASSGGTPPSAGIRGKQQLLPAAADVPQNGAAPGVNRLAATTAATREMPPSISAIEQSLAALAADYDVRLPLATMPDRGGEFLAALTELFEVGPHELERLRQAAVLGDVAVILAQGAGKSRWLDRPFEIDAVQPSAAGDAAAALEAYLVDFVVEQTGYPKEIVELDADLEADLGIDSIRKAQLFGEIGQKYGLSADASLSLDDFRTLRHLLDYILPRVAGGTVAAKQVRQVVGATSGPAAATNGATRGVHATDGHDDDGHEFDSRNGQRSPARASTAQAMLAEPEQTAGAGSDLETFLIDFVVEQTGYPREIVELDADLEADLGIDSIRKAQLFGEIGQKYGLSADASLSLDDFRTLRHLLDYMMPRVGAGAGSVSQRNGTAGHAGPGRAAPSAPPAGVEKTNGHGSPEHQRHATNGQSHEVNGQSHAGNGRARAAGRDDKRGVASFDAAAAADLAAGLETFLIDFVVEQTGYPREIVELDADLEADLGIDSIRKAQLFGEIGQKYGLSADASLSLDDFRTLRHLLDYMLPRVGGGAASAAVGSTPTSPAIAVSDEVATAVRLWVRQMAVADRLPTVAAASVRLPADVAARLDATAAAVGVDLALLRTALVCPAAAIGGFDVTVHAGAGGEHGVAIGFGRHALPTCTAIDPCRLQGFIVGVAGLPGGLVAWNEAGFVVIARPEKEYAPGTTPVTCAVERVAGCRTLDEAAAAVAALAPLSGSLLVLSGPAEGIHGIDAAGNVRAVGSAWRECASGSPLVKVAGDGAGGVAVGRVLADAAGVGVRDGLSATATWMAAGVTAARAVAFAGGPQGTWLPAAAAEMLAAAWEPIAARHASVAAAPSVTGRFSLASADLAMPTPIRDLRGERVVILAGAAADEDLTRRLDAAITAQGATVQVIVAGDATDTSAALAAAEEHGTVRHLVITTPFAAPGDWVESRGTHIAAAYFACQRWLAARTRAGDTGRATLTAVTALGGDFGLSGAIGSAVGGAIAGLFKGLAREYPDVQVRVVDVSPTAAAGDVAALVADEIRSVGPVEVGWHEGRRRTVVAVERPPRSTGRIAGLAPGSIWLVTGGARGVTAACARALGSRHGLQLVLVGSTRPGAVEEAWLSLDDEGLKTLKGKVMLDAKAAGADPRQAWREVEKSIEINRELARFRAAGVAFRYECCDLADVAAVRELVQRVEGEVGPIRGLVHGAGWESACKFEKKTAAGLEATLGPKCVGLENVLAAIDPRSLESVVAFGSTSGRLGGLGQADYSLANDMLAKIVGRLRRQRPHVRGTVFHWHAWDEVGMASRPESRFVLEQFGMKFMPLAEGVGRFLAEIEAGLPEAEVLVTEHVFCRGTTVAAPESGVVECGQHGGVAAGAGSLVAAVERTATGATVQVRLDPTADRFLIEHRQYGRPLLPAVMGAEILAQAAIAAGACDLVAEIRDFVVERPIAFPTDAPRLVHVDVAVGGGRIEARARLAGNSPGMTAGLDRVHVSGVVGAVAEPIETPCTQPPLPFFPTAYADEAPLQHGPAFRTLAALFFDRSGGWARLTAPDEAVVAAPRGAAGWTVPVALLDGCIVACGYYSHVMCGQRVEIPLRFDRLRLVDRPRAGEHCTARILFRTQDAKVTVYDVVLFGGDRRPLLALDGLHLAVMAPERSVP